MTKNLEDAFAAAQQKYHSGDLADAADLYQAVLEINPRHPDALHMLGVVAYQLGQPEAAAALLQQAVSVKQPFADAESNLGTVLLELGKLDDALSALRDAHSHAPDNPAILYNLGNAHRQLKNWPAAKAAYTKTIALDDQHAQAWCQLGLTLTNLGEATAAVAAYERALDIQPDHSQALYNLANVQRDLGQLGEAEYLLRRAIAARSDYAMAWNSLGTLLGDMARSDEALEAFDQAVKFAPESAAYASNRLCGLQYVPGITTTRLAEAHTEWYWLHIATSLEAGNPAPVDADPDRTLRIGFVSPDFGKHPVGYLSAPLFEHTSPQSLETIVLNTRPADLKDALSRRIEIACTAWHDVAELDDGALAQFITTERIDILLDMSGQTAGNRLAVFARQPAPVQMSWIGYVGSTGLPMMNYVIGDAHQFPRDAEKHYTERLLKLPNGYTCYAPPDDAPDVGPLPASTNGHVTFGCLNNPAKLNYDVIQTFASVLKAVDHSQLLMRFRGLDDPVVQAPILKRFKKHGIAQDRIAFEGRADHHVFLDTYNRVDMALDTFPYSGGLTTCEALWMGVPTLTVPGETFAGRHAATYLSTTGYNDYIVSSRDKLVERAASLASDLTALAELRAKMRNQVAHSPLCDGAAFAAGFEAKLREAWKNWCATQ
ncbi:MAG: tetratricopeptide repeat protein [Rhodospirillaceae bacterium]